MTCLFVFELRRDVYMDLVLEMQCLASLSLQEKAVQITSGKSSTDLQSVLLLCTSKLIVVKLVTILACLSTRTALGTA